VEEVVVDDAAVPLSDEHADRPTPPATSPATIAAAAVRMDRPCRFASIGGVIPKG
jgi:hypothetical protein